MPVIKTLEAEIKSNRVKDAARRALYKKHGYDTEKERGFIIECVLPVYEEILEVGTGKGHFAIELVKRGYKLTSVDVASENQTIARLNLAYLGMEEAVTLKHENAEKLSFKNGVFNTVFMVNTLHHLENPFKVLSELLRVTCLSGRMIISDFTEKGFAMLDTIHAIEGGVHETGKITLKDIQCHLTNMHMDVQTFKSDYQEILVIRHKKASDFDLFA